MEKIYSTVQVRERMTLEDRGGIFLYKLQNSLNEKALPSHLVSQIPDSNDLE